LRCHAAGLWFVVRDLQEKDAINKATTARWPVCRANVRDPTMADVNPSKRPLSPHLQIYRPQLTAITSILTRITGNALIVAAVLIVWWLLAAATGPAYFAVADCVLRSWFGKLVFFGSIWAVWYHFLAGLRHLWFDSGRGLDIPTAERLGKGMIAGSVVLTLLTVIIL
jgi:succinate dehydrogenase / fumarate reductase cytochrome b subunit